VEGVPGFQVQSVQTTARVRADQSLILGGLLSYEESLDEQKVPILGSIPVLAPLFTWKQKQRVERELLFVITPRLMLDALEGIDEPVELPSLHANDHPLGEVIVPATLLPDGRPSSWRVAEELMNQEADRQRILNTRPAKSSDENQEEALESDLHTPVPRSPPTTFAHQAEAKVDSCLIRLGAMPFQVDFEPDRHTVTVRSPFVRALVVHSIDPAEKEIPLQLSQTAAAPPITKFKNDLLDLWSARLDALTLTKADPLGQAVPRDR